MTKTISKFLAVIFITIISITTNVQAQKNTEYIMHHKNGSVIKGIITSQTADSVTMQTKSHDIFVFSRSDISYIKHTKAEVRKKKDKELFDAEKYSKGFYSYSTIGLLANDSKINENMSFSLNTILGYEFKYWLGVGIGVGLESQRTTIMPIQISCKSHIFNNKYSPMVNLSVGYAIPLRKTEEKTADVDFHFEGGFHWGFDIGVASFRTNNYAFTVSAGYQYQRVKETSDALYYYNWKTKYKEISTYDFHKIAVRIGFLFR